MLLSPGIILRIALQLVGVLTIIKGLIQAVGTLGVTVGANPASTPYVILIFAIILPLLMILIGSYLLLGSKKIVAKLYPDPEQVVDSARALFGLALKIIGVVILVNALPDAVKVLAQIIYLQSIKPLLGPPQQMQDVFTSSFSTLVYLLLGWYLLRGGGLFLRLAFRDEKASLDEHPSSS